ncbi:autoinducer binding domain-containing protein [Burkholderia cepacia]|nr:autoinducer binding domain-containing protein [Burkholderia cepacia]
MSGTPLHAGAHARGVGFIPLLGEREHQYDGEQRGERFRPEDEQGFHDHSPMMRSTGGAMAPASSRHAASAMSACQSARGFMRHARRAGRARGALLPRRPHRGSRNRCSAG